MQPISDFQLRQRFMEFGDIKDIVPHPISRECAIPSQTSFSLRAELVEKHRERILEYYDSRATKNALEKLNGIPMFGGTLELEWTWDEGPPMSVQV